MRKTSFQFLSLPLLVVAALAAQAGCQVKYRRDVEKPGTEAKHTYSAGGFIRYDGYDDVAGDLEIASREYVKPGSGARIRLVGVIHIADLEYYRTLQDEALDTADVVLFEGVKFDGREAENAPDLGGLYGVIGSMLGIVFQKDGIDYAAKNFVHCDVTVKEGDPLFQSIDPEMVKQAGQMLQPLTMMKTMLSVGGEPRRTEDALKHGMVTIMAMQLDGMDAREAAEKTAERLGANEGNEALRGRAEQAIEKLRKALPEGSIPGLSPEMNREILDRRNDYVVQQLAERLEADGEQKKQTIAIFYGAAHMPGIEKELRAWGYQPAETTWFKAWRMNGAGMPILAERAAGEGPKPATAAAPNRAPGRKRDAVLY